MRVYHRNRMRKHLLDHLERRRLDHRVKACRKTETPISHAPPIYWMFMVGATGRR